ncbi:MAG: hypothetical protein GPI90_09395 [Microcystis aeruginosa K13-05]|jgi:hypothetical protein|uniref:DUF104 domain-containing protein n=1 Tax=Microcystis aeruginosa 11-30S32 TaxID=2358142 RepID=A0A510PGA8_MICAE|nr:MULTISPECIES: hypothetical protein [Microcystis]NCR80274.1 hypothetical protein [Microcystis aeruginosa K13-10]NCR84858.1 hypothetical protein [Microcystis aeruginosa K13-05]MCA2813327.1 hypothetical protein [Microcystis sp. M090S1]MCZ8049803.1 hypothetical protein [Microcystis sp. LE19-41.2A]MCZ8117799.1 hypothetical protein [Microcystis sp. LE18-22.4A]
MKIQGIIKGNTIELLEDLSLPNGVKISRSIPDNLIQKKLLWEDLETLIGVWKNQPELDDIFSEIDQERHADLGVEIKFDD